jgi:DNA-binding NarL/FixJ family response regulator
VTDSDRRATVAVLAEALDQHGTDLAVLPDLAVLTELRLACGLSDAAAESAGAIATLAAADVGEALRGYARLVAGLIASSEADDTEARDALREAVRHFAASRLPLERARAQVALAEACAASDPGAALAEARDAAETFAWLDATDELDRAAGVLRSVGGRRSPPVSGSHDLLTTREHEVLTLVAEGLSNPEIADRLFLSRKTVAHHVSNVLAKLGVRNRAEAAAWFSARAARSGSDDP